MKKLVALVIMLFGTSLSMLVHADDTMQTAPNSQQTQPQMGGTSTSPQPGATQQDSSKGTGSATTNSNSTNSGTSGNSNSSDDSDDDNDDTQS